MEDRNIINMTKLLFSFIVLYAVIIMSTNAGIAGGLGEVRPVDNDVTSLIERLKPDIIKKICDSGVEKCPSTNSKIVVNNYKTQVVAGTNYFVSATVDDNHYHIRIFSQPWTQTEEVAGVAGPKQLGEEITYF